jgi:hypothetical protein
MSLTFQPFTALGAGNGFPFCATPLDVTDFDLVAPMTLEQAMRLFWLTHEIKAEAKGEYSFFDNKTLNTLINDAVAILPVTFPDIPPPILPIQRVCRNTIIGSSGSTASEFDEEYFLQSLISISINNLRRLISGGDFIGYGYQNAFSSSTIAIEDFGRFFFNAEVRLNSFVQTQSTSAAFDYAIREVSGIPFVVTAIGETIADAENLTAKSQGSYDDPLTEYDLEASITGLQFYEPE